MKQAILPVQRCKGALHRGPFSCAIGAQERIGENPNGLWSERAVEVEDATDYGLAHANDDLRIDGLPVTPTERTMFLGLLFQAAGYTVKVVDR